MKPTQPSLADAHPATRLNRSLASLVACALLLGVGLTSTVQAQSQPTDPTAPSTQTSKNEETRLVTQTTDGRAFRSLKEIEVDRLPRREKVKYYAWLEAQDDAKLAEIVQDNKRLDAQIEENRKKLSALNQSLADVNVLLEIVDKFQKRGTLTPEERARAVKALTNANINSNLRNDLSAILGLNRSSPQ